MSKWKCEICGTEFKNFHAQGFEGKIYCPLCYFKKEKEYYKLTKEDLIDFCIKFIKTIERCNL